MSATLLAAGSVAQGLFNLIDKLFTSDEERSAAKLKLLELEKSGELAQISVNTQEAAHASVFVAGWRPFVGWVGGVSLLILAALMIATGLGYIPVGTFQIISGGFMTTTLPILGGRRSLRTFDKWKGTDTQVLSPLNTRVSPDGVDRRAL